MRGEGHAVTCYTVGFDNAAWGNVLSQLALPYRDVYFTLAYHQLHVVNGDCKVECMVLAEGGQTLMVPGMRAPIPSDDASAFFDLQSCNGYGGPLASPSASRDFLEQAWGEWQRRSAATGIVAGFFRLHPLLANECCLPESARVILDRQTVFVDLADGPRAAWQRADARHRNMVNKGQREGLRVDWQDPTGWDDFELLYNEAMRRLNAPSALRFSHAYFAGLRQLPGAALACIRRGDALAAAAVFLFGPIWGHYHLSAHREGSGNHLTNCLLQSALERCLDRGLRGLHLGGGRTSSPEDTLLKFKLGLGGRLLDFKVALVVANLAHYRRLCDHWAQKTGVPPKWLLGYRQPKPPIAPLTSA